MKLLGQRAVVTGASRGIGRSVALRLAHEGADVAVVARSESQLRELGKEIRALGRECLEITADVAQVEDVERLSLTVLNAWPHVDILVNNAGIAHYAILDELTISDYDAMMNTNMRSTFLCTKAFLKNMKDRRYGHIVNIASVAGKRGFATETVYCASKFAQVGFAQALDQELREFNVKVTSVCPGGVNTSFAVGTGRTAGDPRIAEMLDPDDVADVVSLVVTQRPGSRIIEVLMRPMGEPL
ncbi:MAG: SDR family oxidoreductase [Bacilli bacterium]